jgi:hypothetical protein
MYLVGRLGDLVADMLEGGFCFPVLCELAWGPLWQRQRKVEEAFQTLPRYVMWNFANFMRRWDATLYAYIREYDYSTTTFIPMRDAGVLSIVIA